jgi:hypothetical protein
MMENDWMGHEAIRGSNGGRAGRRVQPARELPPNKCHGPVAATKIKALAEKRGIGREIDEAKEALGVTAERLNSGRGNVVNWGLPS